MQESAPFIDHYNLLQVDFDCDARRLELAYHYFAKVYHPDSGETANTEKFSEVVSAYKILRDPAARAEYDKLYLTRIGQRPAPAASAVAQNLDESAALRDAETHDQILFLLYKRRRENAFSPGIVGWLLEESLDCTESQFEFHAWYLKSKGLMEFAADGTFAITVEGVDYVISRFQASEATKLLLRQYPAEAENSAEEFVEGEGLSKA